MDEWRDGWVERWTGGEIDGWRSEETNVLLRDIH